MKDATVKRSLVPAILAALALAAAAAPALAQGDAAFLTELQKKGFSDIARQFAADHAGVGAAAEAKARLTALQAELNAPATTPQKRGELTTQAVALAREMLKIAPPQGETPDAVNKQIEHANLQMFLVQMLLNQNLVLFQNAVLFGLGREEAKRFRDAAEEVLSLIDPAAEAIDRIIKIMENDDDFDKNYGEKLYVETEGNQRVAKYLKARAQLYLAWTLPKAVDPANPNPQVAADVQRRADLLDAARREMDFWSRQPETSGVLYESKYLLGVILWQQALAGQLDRFAEAEVHLKAAQDEKAPVVVQFMSRAALVRCLLAQKKYDKAAEAVDEAVTWTGKHEEDLGANAEYMVVLLKSDITFGQAYDARKRGLRDDYLRLKREGLAILTKYAISKPELKASLYQKYVERLLAAAREAASSAPKPPTPAPTPGPGPTPAPAPGTEPGPVAQPSSRPAPSTLADPDADILPDSSTLEPFELAALGAVMQSTERYDASRYYLEDLVERKDETAEHFHNEGLFNLAVALYNLGRREKAADRFVDLAEEDPAFPRCLDGLDYAATIYVQQLELDPTQESVRLKLERALDLMEKLPDSPEKKVKLAVWRLTRADNLRQLKRFREAVEQFKLVGPEDPQYYEARYDVARSSHDYCEQLKDQNAADFVRRSAATEAIDECKKFTQYAEAEVAKLTGTPEADKLLPNSTIKTIDGRINDKGQAELWIIDLLINLTPPGAGETRQDLLRKAVPMLEAFPDKYPAQPQRQLVAQALGDLAGVWLELGDLDRAVKVVEDFKKRFPEGSSGLIADILDALVAEVERLKKAGLAEQAKSKAVVAARLVESQIDWVKTYVQDPAERREGLYRLTQQAAGLYREAGQPEKAIEYYGRLILDRQRLMIEGMLAFIKDKKNIPDDPKLVEDCTKAATEVWEQARILEEQQKWQEAATALEGLRDNLWRWVSSYCRTKWQECSPLFNNLRREMIEGMLAFVKNTKNIPDDPKLVDTWSTAATRELEAARVLEGQQKGQEAARALQDLCDNLRKWVSSYYSAKKATVPAEFDAIANYNGAVPREFNAVSDDATNYRGMALTYEDLKQYDDAKRRWWKLYNTLPSPDRPGGSIEAKQQWWEALYHAIRCDLLAGNKETYGGHILRLKIIIAGHPDLGGPLWKDKFLELQRDLIKANTGG